MFLCKFFKQFGTDPLISVFFINIEIINLANLRCAYDAANCSGHFSIHKDDVGIDPMDNIIMDPF